MKEDVQFQIQRDKMVIQQIKRRGIHNQRLLDVFQKVPRHCFVSESMDYQAYDDHPLPIGHGQTISQPYIVALMTSLLELQGDENVLEVGTGSGYQAAILAHLARTIHSIELHAGLAEHAQKILAELNLNNVIVHCGDGSLGWPEAAPFNAIIITAAAPHPPEPLLQQLSEDGRLVVPVGPRYQQELQLWRRESKGFSQEKIIPVAFVPLRGVHGWDEHQWKDNSISFI